MTREHDDHTCGHSCRECYRILVLVALSDAALAAKANWNHDTFFALVAAIGRVDTLRGMS